MFVTHILSVSYRISIVRNIVVSHITGSGTGSQTQGMEPHRSQTADITGQQDPRKVWIYNAIHLRLSRTIQDLDLKLGGWAKRNGFFLLVGVVDLVLQRLTSIYLTKNFLLYFFLGQNATVGSYI